MKATASRLAETAERLALKPFHGSIAGKKPNIAPLIAHFPKWRVAAADGQWCAAFVYHCCVTAGFNIPYSPDECISCSLAGCGGWDEFTRSDKRIGYFMPDGEFMPLPGDIVIYDRLLSDSEHDHIGIVLEVSGAVIVTTEGNVMNESKIMKRSRTEHVRAYARIPDGYAYR